MPIRSYASGVAICEELEAYLRRTCDTRVSVHAVTFTALDVRPEHFASTQRLRRWLERLMA